jgi:predicted molibdopterin-dependent oxidoreductase YjgC
VVNATQVLLDGTPVTGQPGESVATLLLRQGIRGWRRDQHGAPRGLFCAIGQCFDCILTVDGERHVRACVTPVRPGMAIDTDLGSA